jgi:hypothetical protein
MGKASRGKRERASTDLDWIDRACDDRPLSDAELEKLERLLGALRVCRRPLRWSQDLRFPERGDRIWWSERLERLG